MKLSLILYPELSWQHYTLTKSTSTTTSTTDLPLLVERSPQITTYHGSKSTFLDDLWFQSPRHLPLYDGEWFMDNHGCRRGSSRGHTKKLCITTRTTRWSMRTTVAINKNMTYLRSTYKFPTVLNSALIHVLHTTELRRRCRFVTAGRWVLFFEFPYMALHWYLCIAPIKHRESSLSEIWCCNSKNLVATFYAIVGLQTHTSHAKSLISKVL